MVYSATSASAAIGGGNSTYFLKRQGLFALLGLVALVVARRWHYRRLRNLAPSLLIVSLCLLLFALVAGQNVNGARRWIELGPATFQPSELAKLTLCIWTALYLARRPVPQSLGALMKPIGLVAVVFCGLVLAEPDLGTVIAIGVMIGAMLLIAGAPVRVLGAATAISGAVVLFSIWLEPYRRTRIFSFIDPWHDAQGAGIPDGAGDDRARLRRDLRRRARPGCPEGLLPPGGPHRHDLRDHRRGTRPRRRHARDRGLCGIRLGGAEDRDSLQRSVR